MNPAKFKMKTATNFITVLLLFLTYTQPTTAFFRHLCHGTLAIGRYDPLMSPGKVAQHVHNVKGASNFGFDTDYPDLQASNCTSCTIIQDKSAYWTPYMYFRHDNGTFELVPDDGGLTAYYFTERPDVGTEITPFKPGFRMIAGNSAKRQFYGLTPDPPMSSWTWADMTQQAIMEKSLGFNCLHYGVLNEPSMGRHEMPTKAFIDDNCYDGIRAEVQFPSCWDGVNLDSANHTTHVAYPSRLRNGDCPSGYPIRLPTLFYETIYPTGQFRGVPGQFVFANGDPTGNGYHGDFINGWDDGVMQQVIDHPLCTGPASSGNQWQCPVFNLKSLDGPGTTDCKVDTPEVLQSEEVNYVQMLPGAVPIQTGPDHASAWVVPASAMPTAADQTMGAVKWVAQSSPAAGQPSPILGSAAPYANATSSAAPTSATSAPPTTAAPTAPTQTGDFSTWTSIATSNGIVYNWVIVEEVVTTTVIETATPAPVKRHIHHHRFGRNGRNARV